jgi:hypothetical protein
MNQWFQTHLCQQIPIFHDYESSMSRKIPESMMRYTTRGLLTRGQKRVSSTLKLQYQISAKGIN